MSGHDIRSAARPEPDQVLQDIADDVFHLGVVCDDVPPLRKVLLGDLDALRVNVYHDDALGRIVQQDLAGSGKLPTPLMNTLLGVLSAPNLLLR